jgi:Flp pilus assembly protein TadG
MTNFFSSIGRFCGNKRGNVAVTFVIASLPIMSAIGCAVDYSQAVRLKVKLQSAADAASVAAISQKSPGYIAAAAMTGNGSVAAAVTDAGNIFDGDVNGIPDHTTYNITRTPVVTKTGVKLASSVTFSATVPTMFMRIIGPSFQTLTVTGSSSSSASLPPYLDFYLALDVSGSMGLPSTSAEAGRLAEVNPDDYVDYVSGSPPTGCTLACHFTTKSNGCNDPTVPAKKLSSQSGYPVNNYCLGYLLSRVSQSGYQSLLINQPTQGTYPWKNPFPLDPNYLKYQQLPTQIVSGLPNSLYAPKVSVPPTGGTAALTGGGLTPVTNCPSPGGDSCIQLRLDAVGYALTQLFVTANNDEKVANQFRIGLYPFITDAYAYFPLTASINGSTTNSSTINYAAANLATLLDTNLNSNLGSGGTHIDKALHTINGLIASVGDGSSATNPQPYIFLVTDGAQDPQSKGVPNGGWSGSNHAVTLDNAANSYPSICSTIKSRGIIISVLYIPYTTISPVVAAFANDEDDAANNNIPSIPPSLQTCASPGYFYTANTPTDINNSLQAMFSHVLQTAHITN